MKITDDLLSYSPPLWATFIAGLLLVITLTLSIYLIFEHLASYKNPEEQKFLIGVILMVPCYSIESTEHCSKVETVVWWSWNTSLKWNLWWLLEKFASKGACCRKFLKSKHHDWLFEISSRMVGVWDHYTWSNNVKLLLWILNGVVWYC